jgi:hypothetical protein
MGKKWEAKRKEEKGINYQLCVCVVVAAVQQVIELCAFKKKNTHWATTTTKK